MEFTPDTMNKLAKLLREPEPDVLQGDDLPYSGITIFGYLYNSTCNSFSLT